jgi:DNA-binding transcriptional LysR family regulator
MAYDRKLDVHQLSVLEALLETGSASEAAVRLGISQPAVSGALAKLRLHFNDPLFIRTPGGMTPTPRGAEVASTARDILRQLDERLRGDAPFDPKDDRRPFTFALSDVGEIVFLPRLVRRLSQLAHGAPVRSVSMRPAALADALAGGEVDLAIGYFPDLTTADFFQQQLFVHHFVCLLREDHAVQGNRPTMTEYLSLDHAVVHSEGRSQEILEQYLAARGLTRRIAVYTPHFLSIPKLIAGSDMVVAVPHAVGIAYGTHLHRLKVIDLPFESPRIELRQHWHRRVHKDARNVWLRGLVSDLFNATTDEWGRCTSLAH